MHAAKKAVKRSAPKRPCVVRPPRRASLVLVRYAVGHRDPRRICVLGQRLNRDRFDDRRGSDSPDGSGVPEAARLNSLAYSASVRSLR